MYTDPKLNDAFKKAIKFYFDNNELNEYNKTVGKRKYDKKYFDGMENELFPSEEKVDKKVKGKKK